MKNYNFLSKNHNFLWKERNKQYINLLNLQINSLINNKYYYNPKWVLVNFLTAEDIDLIIRATKDQSYVNQSALDTHNYREKKNFGTEQEPLWRYFYHISKLNYHQGFIIDTDNSYLVCADIDLNNYENDFSSWVDNGQIISINSDKTIFSISQNEGNAEEKYDLKSYLIYNTTFPNYFLSSQDSESFTWEYADNNLEDYGKTFSFSFNKNSHYFRLLSNDIWDLRYKGKDILSFEGNNKFIYGDSIWTNQPLQMELKHKEIVDENTYILENFIADTTTEKKSKNINNQTYYYFSIIMKNDAKLDNFLNIYINLL